MKILIAAATWPELSPLEGKLQFVQEKDYIRQYRLNNAEIHLLFTGVGMTATAVSVTAALAKNKYDKAINAGICGAFDRSIALGEVVLVHQDRIPELGAEDGSEFLTIHDMQLHGESEFPYVNGWIHDNSGAFPEYNTLRRCKGITVNTAHGNDESIDRVVRSFNPDVETMEGAAFLMSALHAGVPAVQLRAVSNYVERRDKSKWNIPLSISNLNAVLFTALQAMTA
jgi:futalosine hydrolase